MSIIKKISEKVVSLFSSNSPQHFPVGTCESVLNGQLILSDAEVKVPTLVNGVLEARGVTFFSLIEINGQVTCYDCLFEDDVLMRGAPFLKKNTFKKSIEVFASKVSLDACEVKTLYLTHPFSKDSLFSSFSLEVYLKNTSLVQDIIFDRPGGKIYCEEGSQVERVKNGEIIVI
jgi:hypothetical protein